MKKIIWITLIMMPLGLFAQKLPAGEWFFVNKEDIVSLVISNEAIQIKEYENGLTNGQEEEKFELHKSKSKKKRLYLIVSRVLKNQAESVAIQYRVFIFYNYKAGKSVDFSIRSPFQKFTSVSEAEAFINQDNPKDDAGVKMREKKVFEKVLNQKSLSDITKEDLIKSLSKALEIGETMKKLMGNKFNDDMLELLLPHIWAELGYSPLLTIDFKNLFEGYENDKELNKVMDGLKNL